MLKRWLSGCAGARFGCWSCCFRFNSSCTAWAYKMRPTEIQYTLHHEDGDNKTKRKNKIKIYKCIVCMCGLPAHQLLDVFNEFLYVSRCVVRVCVGASEWTNQHRGMLLYMNFVCCWSLCWNLFLRIIIFCLIRSRPDNGVTRECIQSWRHQVPICFFMRCCTTTSSAHRLYILVIPDFTHSHLDVHQCALCIVHCFHSSHFVTLSWYNALSIVILLSRSI